MNRYTWRGENLLIFNDGAGPHIPLSRTWVTMGVDLTEYDILGHFSGFDLKPEAKTFDYSSLEAQKEPRFIIRGKAKLNFPIVLTSEPGSPRRDPIRESERYDGESFEDVIVDVRSSDAERLGELTHYKHTKQPDNARRLHVVLHVPEPRLDTFVTDIGRAGYPPISVAFVVALFVPNSGNWVYLLPAVPKPSAPAAMHYISFNHTSPGRNSR